MRSEARRPLKGAFRWVALAAAVMVYVLIVAGGVVRVTGAGLGCPDWPLCYGRLLPPLRIDAILEYSHRLAASLASPLVLATAVAAWVRHRSRPWVLRPALAAVALLVVQVSLGAVTVILETPSWIVAIHLAVALLILALQSIVVVVAFRGGDVDREVGPPLARSARIAAASVFVLLISGGLVAGTGATAACGGFPLCDGRLWPADVLGGIQMLHRALAFVAGALVVRLAWKAWRKSEISEGVRVTAVLSGVLIVVQAAIGALNVLRGFPPLLSGLHVATAAAVWSLVVISAALASLQPGAPRRAEEARGKPGSPKDYLALTKPIITALLLVTTLAGMIVGAQALPDAGAVAWTMLGGALAAGGASAINQYTDRDLDARMARTRRRPIPGGRLDSARVLTFGLVLCTLAFYVLAVNVNLLSALLALVGMIYYAVLYGLVLKRSTVHNIVVGGGAGAIPPLVGWAAATGSLDLRAFFLFAVVFFWTPAHFWALALLRERDYRRAGVPMLPVVHGEREARTQILLYAIQVVLLTLILSSVQPTGLIYLASAIVLGGGLVVHALRLWREGGSRTAWRMYRYSSLYLALLFAALIADTLIRN
jgi:protoheme IX farnesyltransferase